MKNGLLIWQLVFAAERDFPGRFGAGLPLRTRRRPSSAPPTLSRPPFPQVSCQKYDAKLCGIGHLGYEEVMDGHRVNQALARIEGAIARIEAASADRGASVQGGEDSLIQENILQENRALREAVQTSLRDLDAVIGKLGA